VPNTTINILAEKIKTIIIDDEEDARASIRIIVNSFSNNLDIIAEADSVQTAYNKIIKHKPQLIFLDIDLSDGTGFDLLSKFNDYNFKIIFVTGSNQSAIKAFRFNALDYILKPIDPDEFIDAIKKAVKHINQSDISIQLNNLLQQQTTNSQKNIILNTLDDIHVIEIENIVKCESDGNYTTFYLNNDEKVMVSKNIKEYAELLDGHNFFRSHQSHLVNLNYFSKYHKKDGGYIVLKDNSTVPVSKRKKEALMQSLTRL